MNGRGLPDRRGIRSCRDLRDHSGTRRAHDVRRPDDLALLPGRYLSALGILTPHDGEDPHARMLRGAAAEAHRGIVLKPERPPGPGAVRRASCSPTRPAFSCGNPDVQLFCAISGSVIRVRGRVRPQRPSAASRASRLLPAYGAALTLAVAESLVPPVAPCPAASGSQPRAALARPGLPATSRPLHRGTCWSEQPTAMTARMKYARSSPGRQLKRC